VNSFNFAHSKLDAAIVDLDGTTVDTLGDFVAALNGMLDELALPHVAPDAVGPLVGKGSEHLISSVLRHVRDGEPAGADLYAQAWEAYQRHYPTINGRHSTVYPGVVDGLRALRAGGLRLVCVTNKPTAFARTLLAHKGLEGYYDHVFGGDAFTRKKPDPMPLLESCKALGTLPARTLMVGDSSNDAAAARAAGCPVVLVSYGFNHGEPVREVDADGFVDSLAELGLLMIDN